MGEEYIIDCAGNRIAVGDKLFAAKCWVGNSSDYLAANGQFIIAESAEWLDIPKISIIVPIYRSGDGFLATLQSLCNQQWEKPSDVEIILYINQPEGDLEELTKKSINCAESFSAEEPDNYPVIRIVTEQLPGGLAEVYQRGYSSLVSRVRSSVEGQNLETKDEKVAAINSLMNSTVFAVVDDDQVLCDNTSFPDAVYKLQADKSVIMGQVDITSVSCAFPRWNESIKNIMNLFFAFKYELGTVILTPRAIMMADLFHQPGVDIGAEYADQIWFAAAANGKQRFMINVTTTLVEEEYPSNAQMASRIARYLETGDGRESLQIFENLLCPYSSIKGETIFTQGDINNLIVALETRDLINIEQTTQKLINKKVQK